MNKIIYLLAVLCVILWTSCSKDLGTTSVSYTKAVGVYGNIDEVRATPLIGQVQSIEDPGKIYAGNQYILIGEESKGIHVLDNTDTANPIQIGFINVPGNREFFVQNNFLYAESYYDMLKIDLSNPSSPSLVNRVNNYFESKFSESGGEVLLGFNFSEVTEEVDSDDEEFWHSFYQHDQVLYDNLQSVIPPSAVPTSFAGSSNNAIGSVNRITRTKDHVYAINRDRMAIFEDKRDLNLISAGYENVSNMETIFPQGDFLYIGASTSASILGIADPSNPQYLSSFWHGLSCDPVYPLENVAYVTLRTGDEDNCPGELNALVVLDITDKTSDAKSLQEIEMLSPYGVTLIGNILYVGEGEHGLKMFDASDRNHLTLIKHDTSIKAYDIIAHPVSENLVLVSGPEGFGQYDVSDDIEFSVLSWIGF